MDWNRLPAWNRKGISVIWRVVIHTLPIIRSGLTWRIGNGISVHVGVDLWISCGNLYKLSPYMTDYLNRRGVVTIAQIRDLLNTSIYQKSWLSMDALDIPEQWHLEWRQYTTALKESHVGLKDDKDKLIWALAQKGTYTPKEGYPIIHARHKPISLESWWCWLWKLKGPSRTCLLMWNIIKDKTPSGTNLRKFSFQGPS